MAKPGRSALPGWMSAPCGPSVPGVWPAGSGEGRAVYEAEIISGVPTTADDELSDVAWFSPSELGQLTLSRLSQALLKATGHM